MLEDMAYALCLEIEKLPASEQQTKCSVLASNLRAEIARAQQARAQQARAADVLPCGHNAGIVFGEKSWSCAVCGEAVRG